MNDTTTLLATAHAVMNIIQEHGMAGLNEHDQHREWKRLDHASSTAPNMWASVVVSGNTTATSEVVIDHESRVSVILRSYPDGKRIAKFEDCWGVVSRKEAERLIVEARAGAEPVMNATTKDVEIAEAADKAAREMLPDTHPGRDVKAYEPQYIVTYYNGARWVKVMMPTQFWLVRKFDSKAEAEQFIEDAKLECASWMRFKVLRTNPHTGDIS